MGELLIDFTCVGNDCDGYPTMAAHPGGDTCLTYEEPDLSLTDEAKVFHFGTLSLADEPVRFTTRPGGISSVPD